MPRKGGPNAKIKAHPADLLTLLTGRRCTTDTGLRKAHKLISHMTSSRLGSVQDFLNSKKSTDMLSENQVLRRKLISDFPELASVRVPDFSSAMVQAKTRARLGEQRVKEIKEAAKENQPKDIRKQQEMVNSAVEEFALQLFESDLLREFGKVKVPTYESTTMTLIEYEPLKTTPTQATENGQSAKADDPKGKQPV